MASSMFTFCLSFWASLVLLGVCLEDSWPCRQFLSTSKTKKVTAGRRKFELQDSRSRLSTETDLWIVVLPLSLSVPLLLVYLSLLFLLSTTLLRVSVEGVGILSKLRAIATCHTDISLNISSIVRSCHDTTRWHNKDYQPEAFNGFQNDFKIHWKRAYTERFYYSLLANEKKLPWF